LTETTEPATQRLAYSQYLSFAGKPLLVQSNSCVILRHASSFFAQRNCEEVSARPAAELRLMLRSDHDCHAEDAPWFRGKGYFALARFTHADSVWFNLRTCRACGFFSAAIASDAARWHKDILPAVAGILAPAIAVAPVHAACLSNNNSGILLTGKSGVGKSTLAVILARRGYGFLADDWSYLAQTRTGINAWSVPVPVKLLPDAVSYFPELASYLCAHSLNGELAYEVSPQECFGLSRKDHCPIRCIVLLDRSQQPGITISPVPAAEAIDWLCFEIEQLTGQLTSAYRAQIGLLEGLSESVCLRVTFNAPPQEVASAIDDALVDRLTPAQTAFTMKNGSLAQDFYGNVCKLAEHPAIAPRENSHHEPSDVAVAHETDAAPHKGMMNRHTVLDLKAIFEWLGMAVSIDTNCSAILRAAEKAGFIPMRDAKAKIDFCWEFVIEAGNSFLQKPPSIRVFCDEQTIIITTERAGWFTFDFESGEGAGFLGGGESAEAVHAYFRSITEVIKNRLCETSICDE